MITFALSSKFVLSSIWGGPRFPYSKPFIVGKSHDSDCHHWLTVIQHQRKFTSAGLMSRSNFISCKERGKTRPASSEIRSPVVSLHVRDHVEWSRQIGNDASGDTAARQMCRIFWRRLLLSQNLEFPIFFNNV